MKRTGAQFSVPSVLCALACLTNLVPYVAQAQEQRAIELSWDAPPNCPQEAQVQDAVRALVGSVADNSGLGRLRANGRVERVDERFRLTLTINYGTTQSTRVMEASVCNDLGGAAAVALGLLIRTARNSDAPQADSEIAGLPFATTSEAGKPSTVDSVPTVSKVPSVEPTNPSAQNTTVGETSASSQVVPRKQWVVRAPLLTAERNSLPQSFVGLGVGGGMVYGNWRLLAGIDAWLPQTVGVPGFAGMGGRIQRATVDTLVCRGWSLGRFEVAPCLTLSLQGASMRAEGEHVVSRATKAMWLATGGALSGLWQVNQSVGVVLELRGQLATSRPRFVIEGFGEAYRIPPTSVAITLGCEWVL